MVSDLTGAGGGGGGVAGLPNEPKKPPAFLGSGAAATAFLGAALLNISAVDVDAVKARQRAMRVRENILGGEG